MIVKLTGTNVPFELLEKIKKGESLTSKELSALTPETISAAFARVSRSEKTIEELVEESIKDTKKARRSVTNILGIGHHSIADHVMFNFSIMGISRLLVESIERRRLAGYTEKSQRYVTLQGDYVKPEEFSPDDLEKFEFLVAKQNAFYFMAFERIFDFLKQKFAKELDDLEGKEKTNFLRLLKGRAKEDARYSLGFATQAQLGMSYTGQTAELAIRELRYGRLAEEREFSRLLYQAIYKVAPSLIQLADPKLFAELNPGKHLDDGIFKHTRRNLRDLVARTFQENSSSLDFNRYLLPKEMFVHDQAVTRVNCQDIDTNILAALLHANSNKGVRDCYALATLLLKEGKAKVFIKESLKYLGEHDKVPREFEVAGLVYEIVMSASCFAQAKRHRMNTLLAQDYDPELGITIPPNVEEAELSQELQDVCQASSNLYKEFLPKYEKAAEYCLTNAHRRRVILATNLRQLYHISRTREDINAQWDIRDKVQRMSQLAKQVAPVTTILLGGKHEFKGIRQIIYTQS